MGTMMRGGRRHLLVTRSCVPALFVNFARKSLQYVLRRSSNANHRGNERRYSESDKERRAYAARQGTGPCDAQAQPAKQKDT